tara:strand:- start:3378 stop:3647 length:270 start_codon:yes stop_codon:yes gene_type:complete
MKDDLFGTLGLMFNPINELNDIQSVIVDAKKNRLINKLTLLATAEYRKRGKVLTGKYAKEPTGFRNGLFEILGKLDYEDLQKMYELKTK